MKINIKIYLLLFVSLYSCKKDKNEVIFEKQSITTLASEFEIGIQEKTKLRLAFGQAVAKAYQNEDFKNYILSKSKVQGQPYFNEILFALHKDDIVSGTTLQSLIQASIDPEIFDIYGANFIQNVLQNDPLIAIKIPDIFINLDMCKENLAPMIYTQTPEPFTKNNTYSYMAFHKSGYQEMVNINRKPNYFCVVVKYSEDYVLWDLNNKIDENNIPIDKRYSQFNNCWDEIKIDLADYGHSSSLINFKYYFFKDIKKVEKESCLNSNNYNFILDENCMESCKRDCRNPIETKTYIDSIYFRSDYMFSDFAKGTALVYNDNINIIFIINGSYDRTPLFFGYKYAELFSPEISYGLNIEEHFFESIGSTWLPKIDIDVLTNEVIVLKTDFLLSENCALNSRTAIDPFFVTFSDIILERQVISGIDSDDFFITSTQAFKIGNDLMNYCDNGDRLYNFSAFLATIKY